MAVSDELLGPILRKVSRAFSLSLRVLPAAVRPQISLAYLLARITDTIADTDLVLPEKRVEKLRQFRTRIRSAGAPPVDFSHLAREQNTEAERMLLQHSGEAIALLDQTDAVDRGKIQLVLETITRVQEQDLTRFGDDGEVRALETADDLDDYAYRVAGCVGEFWTHLTRAHCFPRAELDERRFIDNAIRFGKGLQLVNILRDLPRDLANGRCYLPAVDLAVAGLQPADLRDPKNWPQLHPVFTQWLETAADHLAADQEPGGLRGRVPEGAQVRRNDLLQASKRPVRAVHEHLHATERRPDRPLPRVCDVCCRLRLRRGRSLRALLRTCARPAAR